MIPHRFLGSDIHGLKDRVTACRRRLRVHRVAQRAHVNINAEELFVETAPVRLSYRSPFTEAEHELTQTLVLLSEQEVGIT